MGMVPPGWPTWRSYNFECSAPPQPIVNQQPSSEADRLRAEAEASRQRQLKEQLNQARQPPPTARPVVTPNTDRLSLEASKKCTEYGFKPATATFEKCVLKLLSK